MSIIDRFLQGGEEVVFKESSRLAETALRANSSLKSFVKSGRGISAIKEIELEGDRQHFALINTITSGAVAPNVLDNLLELADHEDEIIDFIYNLARELSRFKVSSRLSRSVNRSVEGTCELADSAIKILVKMHHHDGLESARRMREEIAKLEEKSDEIKESMIDSAYDTNVDFKSFHHLIEVARISDDILDACQDASDSLLTILSSIIT